MDRTAKARELMAQAKKLGLSFRHESGLIVLGGAIPGDSSSHEVRDEVVKRLVPYIPEIRGILVRESRAIQAKGLLGQPIWSEDSDSHVGFEGTLSDVSSEGTVFVSVQLEPRGVRTQIMADPDKLIVLAKQEPNAESLNDSKPETDHAAQKGLLRILADTFR